MSYNVKQSVLIVGAGQMAIEYIKVLKSLNRDIVVVGRGEESARICSEETGCYVFVGGIDKYISDNGNEGLPQNAIVAVRIQDLADVCKTLILNGVSNIMLEKPGALKKIHLEEIKEMSDKNNSNVFIAYNRRFYSSVLEAKKIIEEDGGVKSFTFEFTEWIHVIDTVKNA